MVYKQITITEKFSKLFSQADVDFLEPLIDSEVQYSCKTEKWADVAHMSKINIVNGIEIASAIKDQCNRKYSLNFEAKFAALNILNFVQTSDIYRNSLIKYDLDLKISIESEVVTCISILPDETFVCVNRNNQVVFINARKYKLENSLNVSKGNTVLSEPIISQ